MIEWIVSSSVLIAAVLLLRMIFRNRISKRLQYALWLLAALRLLLPGSPVKSTLSVANLTDRLSSAPAVQAQLSAPSQSYESALEDVLTENSFAVEVYHMLPQTRQEEIQAEYRQEITQKIESSTPVYYLPRIAMGIWLVGAVLTAGCLLAANVRFSRALKRSRRKPDGISCALPVFLSNAVQTPCLFGTLSPGIYLPEDMPLDNQALECILAHETTHHRHLDHIWATVRCVCLALHWYNPLVWIAVKVSRTDSELACDEGTLEKLGDENREHYGGILIEMSRGKPSVKDYLLTATTMTGDKRSLYHRIRSIAKKQRTILAAVIVLAAVSLVTIGCTFTGAVHEETSSAEPSEETLSTEATTSPETTAPSETTAATETTVPLTTEFPMGALGGYTDGALRNIPLSFDVSSMRFIGDQLLLVHGTGLALIAPESGKVLASHKTPGGTMQSGTQVAFNGSQFAYFEAVSRKILFLDLQLEVVRSVAFSGPDGGSYVVIRDDLTSAYYIRNHAIYVMDLTERTDPETGETLPPEERILCTPPKQPWEMSGLLFEDRVVSVWGRENGVDRWDYFSTETGEHLGSADNRYRLDVWEDQYYLVSGGRFILGDTAGNTRYLSAPDYDSHTQALPALNAVIFWSAWEEDGMQLHLFDISTGTLDAALQLYNAPWFEFREALAGPDGQYIWLLGKAKNTRDFQLFRWDFRANPTEVDTVISIQ